MRASARIQRYRDRPFLRTDELPDGVEAIGWVTQSSLCLTTRVGGVLTPTEHVSYASPYHEHKGPYFVNSPRLAASAVSMKANGLTRAVVNAEMGHLDLTRLAAAGAPAGLTGAHAHIGRIVHDFRVLGVETAAVYRMSEWAEPARPEFAEIADRFEHDAHERPEGSLIKITPIADGAAEQRFNERANRWLAYLAHTGATGIVHVDLNEPGTFGIFVRTMTAAVNAAAHAGGELVGYADGGRSRPPMGETAERLEVFGAMAAAAEPRTLPPSGEIGE